jgi:hypothetical protein
VSSILYLDDNPENLKTVFKLNSHPVPYYDALPRRLELMIPAIVGEENMRKEKNNLKNHLVLFFSNIEHFVPPLESDQIRRTISFNTFWKGHTGTKNQELASYFFN